MRRRNTPVEPDCKENKGSKLSNSNKPLPLRSVVSLGLDRSVSVTLLYHLCFQTVIKTRLDDRNVKNKRLEMTVFESGLTYIPLLPHFLWPFRSQSYISTSSTLWSLNHVFHSWFGLGAPAHTQTLLSIESYSPEIPAKSSGPLLQSFFIRLPAPRPSLYHYLRLLHSVYLYNVTAFVACFLGAVYKVFSVPMFTCQSRFVTQRRALGCCFGAFHTDSILLLNTTPTKQFSWKIRT